RIVSASGPANRWTPLSSRPCLPYDGDVANGRVPWLHGYYSVSSLLRTQPPPSRLRPTSRCRRLYGLPCSDGFLARTRRVSPVAQHVLVTVLSLPPRRDNQPYRSVFDCSRRLRPSVAGSALGFTHFRGHNAFTVITAR